VICPHWAVLEFVEQTGIDALGVTALNQGYLTATREKLVNYSGEVLKNRGDCK
jgi:hypothetical protein